MVNRSSLGVEDPIRVATTGMLDYHVGARDYQRVQTVAQKCVGSNLMDKLLRPVHVLRLNAMVIEAESPAMYDLEDEGFEVVPHHLRGKELADQILTAIE